jgi:hypothetical protein
MYLLAAFGKDGIKATANSNNQKIDAEIEHASISHSVSGNMIYRSVFAPSLTIHVNGSNLPNKHHKHLQFVGQQNKIQEVMSAFSSRAWVIGIDEWETLAKPL